MAIEFAARTDVGLTREQNEDNFLIDRNLQLYIVCDGMGGHQSGEVASATAVNVVRETLLKGKDVLDAFKHGDGSSDAREVRNLLVRAVQTANARIHERGMSSPANRGMGTTLSLLLLLGERGFYAHVGDSRLYRWRGSEIEQLTRDHSFYNEMLASQPEAAKGLVDDRLKNAITRAVGVTASVEVDTDDFALEPGDRFLLCSDGLSGYLDDDEGALERLIDDADLDRVAESMIRYANDSGGKDNVTAILVQIPQDQATAGVGRSETFRQLRAMPLFRHLSDREIFRLIELCDERSYETGKLLWKEGDETDGLYVVVEGQLLIVRGDMLISRIGSGQYVGSITVMDGGRRSAGAKAKGKVKALVLARNDFHAVLLTEPDLGVKLLWGIARSLAARLRTATGRVVQTSAPASPQFTEGDVKFDRGHQPSWGGKPDAEAHGAAGAPTSADDAPGGARAEGEDGSLPPLPAAPVTAGEWWPPTESGAPISQLPEASPEAKKLTDVPPEPLMDAAPTPEPLSEAELEPEIEAELEPEIEEVELDIEPDPEPEPDREARLKAAETLDEEELEELLDELDLEAAAGSDLPELETAPTQEDSVPPVEVTEDSEPPEAPEADQDTEEAAEPAQPAPQPTTVTQPLDLDDIYEAIEGLDLEAIAPSAAITKKKAEQSGEDFMTLEGILSGRKKRRGNNHGSRNGGSQGSSLHGGSGSAKDPAGDAPGE